MLLPRAPRAHKQERDCTQVVRPSWLDAVRARDALRREGCDSLVGALLEPSRGLRLARARFHSTAAAPGARNGLNRTRYPLSRARAWNGLSNSFVGTKGAETTVPMPACAKRARASLARR